MIVFTAMLASACYSAAYVAPKPWCFVFLGVSALLVTLMRVSL